MRELKVIAMNDLIKPLIPLNAQDASRSIGEELGRRLGWRKRLVVRRELRGGSQRRSDERRQIERRLSERRSDERRFGVRLPQERRIVERRAIERRAADRRAVDRRTERGALAQGNATWNSRSSASSIRKRRGYVDDYA